MALLSGGSIDIDQGTPEGFTPLMIASGFGHSGAVRILLNKGANVSIVGDNGATALHLSTQKGHLATSKMLVNKGANLEAATTDGVTPLHMVAEDGYSEVMRVLIEAGANPDSRRLDGATPLFIAAQRGKMNAIRMLLRANANPLLTWREDESGDTYVPLDLASQNGHSGVVRELVQQGGIEGCGGASGGIDALRLAAMNQHVDIMITLTEAGVVDIGTALATAAGYHSELSMKFLLQQRKGDEAAYVNYRSTIGEMPLLFAIGVGGNSSPSPRVARLLVDAGADTTSAVHLTDNHGEVKLLNVRPLALVSSMLREKKMGGKDATEEQLHRLEGIRRLLLRVEAVYAVSFLWPVDVPSVICTTAEGTGRTVATSTLLKMMLPILKRRARRPRVLLAALFRLVVIWCCCTFATSVA